MKIAVPREVYPEERRVAATPASVERLLAMGFAVNVEAGAGDAAGYPDDAYREVGAEVIADRGALWESGDVVIKVRPPQRGGDADELEQLREDAVLISLLRPAANEALLADIAEHGATAFALEAVPRISRAQKMDVLSSMANIVGYRGVIEAAQRFGGFFTGQITAAGRIPPAKVLVIGAGVAGLAAIGTARSLGAVVRAFDTRPAVRDEVRSLGAEFLELDFEEDGTGEGGYAKAVSKAFIEAEMALFEEQAREVDIIITAALVAGAKAPTLVDERVASALKPGSVIVDLAAEQGGNCAWTSPGEIIEREGVTVIGLTDLASRMAHQASQLFASNLVHFIDELVSGEAPETLELDLKNEVIRGALVTNAGEVTWPPPRKAEPTKPKPAAEVPAPPAEPVVRKKKKKSSGHGDAHGAPSGGGSVGMLIAAGAAILGIGAVAPQSFLSHFSIFVLACFIGWQVVWSVTPALHTPLMSVTNAISGIIILAGMVQISDGLESVPTILGLAAVFVAMLNISGGFFVTHRMLAMFRKD